VLISAGDAPLLVQRCLRGASRTLVLLLRICNIIASVPHQSSRPCAEDAGTGRLVWGDQRERAGGLCVVRAGLPPELPGARGHLRCEKHDPTLLVFGNTVSSSAAFAVPLQPSLLLTLPCLTARASKAVRHSVTMPESPSLPILIINGTFKGTVQASDLPPLLFLCR
jgi:hypothetical protein